MKDKKWKLEKLPLRFLTEGIPDGVIEWRRVGKFLEIKHWIKAST